MMSDFRGGWGSEITPKNRTLEGKNRTLGGGGVKNCQKLSDIINGRYLSMIVCWIGQGTSNYRWTEYQ